MIIKQLFINLSILVSLLFFYTQVSKNFNLSTKSSIKTKLLVGVYGGLLSNILMQFSIHIDTTIIDLRHIPNIMLAYFGGFIPALVSMIITMIGRFLISTDMASFLTIIINLCGTLFAIYFSKLKYKMRVKIFYILTFNNLVFSIVFFYVVPDLYLGLKVLSVYWVASYISAYTAFYILCYLRRSQMLFDKYQKDSITDDLTGLNNVRKFEKVFHKLVQDVKDNDQKLSLLYIDIDFFKQVNDSYGHAEGDLVLKELSTILHNSTRPFDIISRNGGEEFTILLLDCSLNRAVEIAERLRGNVKKNVFILNEEKKLNLTVSVGVACYPETTHDPQYLVSDADKALYQAKNTGRNKVCTSIE